jgi:hypothetical protein
MAAYKRAVRTRNGARQQLFYTRASWAIAERRNFDGL